MTRFDFKAYFLNIRKLGIPFTDERIEADIDRCLVCEKRTGIEPSYYRQFVLDPTNPKATVKYSWRPLRAIEYCMDNDDGNVGGMPVTLIGFANEDGTLRQDWRQVVKDCYDGQSTVNWPRYVCFWRDHVPVPMRMGLAAYKGPHDNKVIV